MEKGRTPPELQRMLSCERPSNVPSECGKAGLSIRRLCGSMESGLNKPVVFSNGEALCALCTCVAIAPGTQCSAAQ